jgi:GNAT superfamily N-acetyltransferase
MMALLRECAADMQTCGIDQWDSEYPVTERVRTDIACGTAWVYIEYGQVCGMFIMDENQDPEYGHVDWCLPARRVAVIHRLAVAPAHHRKGIAREMMDFAEREAARQGIDVMRLDTYSRNTRSIPLFLGRGYAKAGQVNFRGKAAPFDCFEKHLAR